jgi:hypothetical protein
VDRIQALSSVAHALPASQCSGLHNKCELDLLQGLQTTGTALWGRVELDERARYPVELVPVQAGC